MWRSGFGSLATLMQPSRIPDGGYIRVEGDISTAEIERRLRAAEKRIQARRLEQRETAVDDWPGHGELPRLALRGPSLLTMGRRV